MRKSLLLVMALLLTVGSQSARAQQMFAYCNYNATQDANHPIFYLSSVFSLPGSDVSSQRGHAAEKFSDYLHAKYPGLPLAGLYNSGCDVFDSQFEAEHALELLRQNDLQAGYGAIKTSWTYVPTIASTATASGLEQKTEAAALYDAEQHAQRAIPFQSGKTFYIKNWDEHSCEQHDRKTSQYAGAATATTFTCTVKFTYSEERNPTASAALGEGETRDAAIQAAKLNHASVTWDEPFCSEAKKRAAYGSATYKVGESGSSSPWYVCTVSYKAQ